MPRDRKYEIMEIESFARSVGFADLPRLGYDGLSGVLIKPGDGGNFLLELNDTLRNGVYEYDINAWLTWSDDDTMPSWTLLSLYDSQFDYVAGDTAVFIEMLRTLDMIDGCIGKTDSARYIENWYNNAAVEALAGLT